MGKEDLNQILIDTLNSNGFADLLAQQIAMSFGEKLMDDFGNKVTEKMGKYIEKAMQDYIEDYGVKEDMEWRVKQAFQGIDKIELLKILNPTPTNKESNKE